MRNLSKMMRPVLAAAGALAMTGLTFTPVQAEDPNTDARTVYLFTAKADLSKQKPILNLKSDSVTVNNGDIFNPEAFITYVHDDSGALPVLQIESNVDMSQDGSYSVVYKAVGLDGKTTEKSLDVTVKTPEEVLEARKAEEEQRQAEEQQKAAEKAAAQAQAQKAAVMAALAANSGGGGSAAASSIIATARALMGSPYVMGGSDPSGFDCSGYTQYVFAMNGINIARGAAAQSGSGYQVSAADAKPGDLVLWTGHAAIYEGNGVIINAMNPAQGIQEVTFDPGIGAGSFMGFYRVPGVN